MTGATKAISFKSSSGLADIAAWCYTPADGIETKGIVHIVHGMAEHHKRYEDFIGFLNANGYIVYMADMLGHGESVKNDDELGFFGKKNGYLDLVEDVKKLEDIAKNENPDLKYIIFGHSMGSFIVRLFVKKYGNTVDKAVFCGSAGKNPLAGIGLPIIKTIGKIKGDHYRSKFIDNLSFGSYNKKIDPVRTNFDWLTTRNDIVDEYIADKYCGFLFTAAGYLDLVSLIVEVNKPEWFNAVPKQLPMYLIAGTDDPVGNYGKGILEVVENLRQTGHSAVDVDLFDGDRHEILNEKDKDDVYKKVLDWINK